MQDQERHWNPPHPNDLAATAGQVFDLLDPPLWLVTAAHEGRRGGLIATFAVRASIVAELPRMVIGIAKQHHTWGLIEGSSRFALHLLYPKQLDLAWLFGIRTGHKVDKLAELDAGSTPAAAP